MLLQKGGGIDLGCKEAATDSNGKGVKGREYQKLEQKLAKTKMAIMAMLTHELEISTLVGSHYVYAKENLI